MPAINGPWVTTWGRPAVLRAQACRESGHVVEVSSGAVAFRGAPLAVLLASAEVGARPSDYTDTAMLVAAAPDLRDLLLRTLEVCAPYAEHVPDLDGLLDVIQYRLIKAGVLSEAAPLTNPNRPQE